VLDGLQAELAASGVDIGSRVQVPEEPPPLPPSEAAEDRATA